MELASPAGLLLSDENGDLSLRRLDEGLEGGKSRWREVELSLGDVLFNFALGREVGEYVLHRCKEGKLCLGSGEKTCTVLSEGVVDRGQTLSEDHLKIIHQTGELLCVVLVLQL